MIPDRQTPADFMLMGKLNGQPVGLQHLEQYNVIEVKVKCLD